MLKIKAEQIRVFQPEADAAFVRRVSDYLRENHAGTKIKLPDATYLVADLPEEIFSKIVGRALRRGRQYGIGWKSTLLSFVVLLFLTAPNFDRHPKAAKLFINNKIIEDRELEIFLDEMTDDDWAEVEANYDAQAWQTSV